MEQLNNLSKIIGRKMSGNYEYFQYSKKEKEDFNKELLKNEMKFIKFYIDSNVKNFDDVRKLKDLLVKLTNINKKEITFEHKARLVNRILEMRMGIEE